MDKPTMDKAEVMRYLTKEIQTLSTNIMNFRSRISFSLWIGPFLVLGALILRGPEKNIQLSMHSPRAWIAALAAAVAYFVLGVFAATIEHHGWNMCNQWRRCIIRLQSQPDMTGDDLEDRIVDNKITKHVIWIYAVAFAMILIAFGATVYLAAELLGATVAK